jgi:hypothetical protein
MRGDGRLKYGDWGMEIGGLEIGDWRLEIGGCGLDEFGKMD